MTSAEPPDQLRKDTRGLPEGYDPRMFYEYRFQKLKQSASGIESLVWKYIPFSISKSLAFAIDPFRDFKVAPHPITPSNRERTKGVDSVLLNRTSEFRGYIRSEIYDVNYHGVALCYSPGPVSTTEGPFVSLENITTQPVLHSVINDTTRRTRLVGSEQGTMDFFRGSLFSPSRHIQRVTKRRHLFHDVDSPQEPLCSERGGTTHRLIETVAREYNTYVTPTAAVLRSDVYNNLRTSELTYLENLIAVQGLGMFKDWSPNSRNYSLFRNVVELKDIPRSIMSIQNTVRDFRSLFAPLGSKPKLQDSIFSLNRLSRNIPNEYLSYHFGWKQLVKDVKDLLDLPTKMSKRYAFLIKRSGKPTTFRTKRDFVSGVSDGVSGFDYDLSPYEESASVSHRIERITQLRMVINAGFDFPLPDGISFRSYNFWDQIGAVPRPTDIYNLIPWSWLLDWFTGLGTYVEVIDNINRDPSLINWGMITGHTKGRLITNIKSTSYVLDDFSEDGIPGSLETTVLRPNNHESHLEYECQIRKDLANTLGVNTTAGRNLSGYQQSIIGAILAQRLDHTIPRTFRPR